jgi:hypothetical protein
MNTTDLTGLKAIALDQHSKGRKNSEALLAAIELVRAFDTETGDWAACLRCSLAFPTDKELTAHYATHYAIHRHGSHR